MIFIEYQKLIRERLNGMHAMYWPCKEEEATHFIAKLNANEQKQFKAKEFHRFPLNQIDLLRTCKE